MTKSKEGQPARRRRYYSFVGYFGVPILSLSVLLLGAALVRATGIEGYTRPLSWWEALYQSLRLFVVNAGKVPDGAPALARAALHLMSWVAPATAAVAFWAFFRRLVYDPLAEAMTMRRHYVIAGAGKLGSALYDIVWSKKTKRILPIDMEESNPFLARLRSEHLPVVVGDASRSDTLLKVNIKRADYFIAVTGDDLANLEAAMRARELGAACPCVVQIKDPYLALHAADMARRNQITCFNPYKTVAVKTIELLAGKIGASDPPTTVVVAGLGNFGKMVVHELLKHEDRPRNVARIRVVDKNREVREQWKRFCDHYDLACSDVDIEVADIRDMDLWRRLVHDAKGQLCVVIATDDDSSNVSVAAMIHTNLAKDKGTVFGEVPKVGEEAKPAVAAKVLVVTRLFRHVRSFELKKNLDSMVFSDEALGAIEHEVGI